MARRWAVTELLNATTRFRRIRGHADIRKLVASLDARVKAAQNGSESTTPTAEKAAWLAMWEPSSTMPIASRHADGGASAPALLLAPTPSIRNDAVLARSRVSQALYAEATLAQPSERRSLPFCLDITAVVGYSNSLKPPSAFNADRDIA
jgi:hypothetical protein